MRQSRRTRWASGMPTNLQLPTTPPRTLPVLGREHRGGEVGAPKRGLNRSVVDQAGGVNDPWPRAATLAAARSQLLRAGAVADGFHGVRVDVQAEDLVVMFRWRLDPTTYGVRFTLPAVPADSPWTGVPVDSAEQWASDVDGWLMEELQTGLVRRAGRRRVAGLTELDPAQQRGWDTTGYQVTPSGWSAPAQARRALTAAGVDRGRSDQLLTGGRLISWLHAYVDNAAGSPVVGRAVVGWVTGTAGGASIDLLTVDTDVPTSVGRMLAHHAVHEAAEAGATQVTSTSAHPWLLDVGFRPTTDGTRQVIDTADPA